MVTTGRRQRNTERPFTLAALVALWILGCGGEVDRSDDVAGELSSETGESLKCGALPDPATCVDSTQRFDNDGCAALLCDGWPDNPYGQAAADFYQVLHCNGVRGVNGRVTGDEMCRDRWKL